MPQAIPVYVINLHRRADRRDFMARQLDGMGVAWEIVPAVDAETVNDVEIARRVALKDPIIRMGRGSACNLLSHFKAFHRIADGTAPAGLVLEDDAELSPDLAAFLREADWLPPGIGIVRFEKWSRRATRKLLGPPLGRSPVPGRTIHRLYARMGGAACYLLTRQAAARLVEGAGVLRFPSDHLLFNPNLSPIARELGIAMVCPALARQDWSAHSSDIAPTTRAQNKSLRMRIRRGWYEINLLPAQMAAVALRGARLRDITYAERTS